MVSNDKRPVRVAVSSILLRLICKSHVRTHTPYAVRHVTHSDLVRVSRAGWWLVPVGYSAGVTRDAVQL